MKEGLLGKIEGVGHWRINVRPASAPAKPYHLMECKEAVEKSSVSIRGWDFPHVSYRNDEHGGYENQSEYIENWTEWSGFNEFWRIYRSSQFLSYISLREDTNPLGDGLSYKNTLNVTGTIYQFTEIFEFCHRMNNIGFYKTGVSVYVSLRNTAGRSLSVGQGRMPFFPDRSTNAQTIDVETHLNSDELKQRYRDHAISLCVEIFDRFAWKPDPSQLKADQEGFYRQEWRY